MSETVTSIWRGSIPKRRTMKDIVQEVSQRHGVSVEEIMGSSTEQRVVRPRMEAYGIIRAELQHSFTMIGNFFGRDHTTILHGVRRYQAMKGAAE